MNTLFPYQIKHADTPERILRQKRVACNLSAPGTGKTYAAMLIAAKRQQYRLLLCSATAAATPLAEQRLPR